MDIKRVQILVEKYIEGAATPEEEAELINWYRQSNEQQMEWLEEKDAVRLRMLSNIEAQTGAVRIRTIRLWPRIAAAASIILALSVTGYFILHKSSQSQYAHNDIKPGHNQATLTLANGRKIILTKGLNGNLAQQGNTLIAANQGESVIYTAQQNTDQPISYNTLSTGKGEQSPYPLILADGSKVMLNALSSITFPTSFNGGDRTVKITGEVLFEVKHDQRHPFRVTANDKTIEDIGTQFDVNAYDDEPAFKTTLIEGAVKVSQGSQYKLLKPGQQAFVQNGTIVIKEVDPENEIAWRNGKFRADGEKLDEIMRQASRWYDVEVVYENDALRNQAFGIIGNRYANVAELLHSLELTQKVKFKINGKTITVIKP